MRRFRLSCPICDHEWEEDSVLTKEDRTSDMKEDAAEYAVLGFMWAGFAFALLFLCGSFAYLAIHIAGDGALVFLLAAVLFLCGGRVLFGGMFRYRAAAEGQLRWWKTIQRPQQPTRSRDDD
jgi:hypothetical protein